MQAATIVPFRQSKLLLVSHEGQPFVPMKPVAEGMGLSWQGQHAKLSSGRLASTIKEILMVAEDGKQREMTCLPLRKLPGWLMSIHPNKVRPELRDGIIAYQNECDDVLWSYWNDGIAARHDDRTVETVLNQTLGTDGFRCLAAVLDGKVRHLPVKSRQRAKMHVWSQVHKAFSVVSAEDIPASQLDAARNFIGSYSLPMEGEWMPKEEQKNGTLTLDQYEVSSLYSFMSHYYHALQITKHICLKGTARLLESKPLMNLEEHLGEASFGFDRLDKRRAEIYQICRDMCADGGYAMIADGIKP